MITKFNKTQLRQFEKYRRQWNKVTGENHSIGVFFHELESPACVDTLNVDKALLVRNQQLIVKYAKPSKFKLSDFKKLKKEEIVFD